jgi:NitT/TauT family transport system ATP-binding protein
MQQRVSLCRSLIHEPELLMLDEPFAALDAFTREELWCVLRDLWQKLRLHRHPRHARPARGGIPRRQHLCDERAPGRIVQVKAGRLPAAAQTRRLLTTKDFADIVHELRAKIAQVTDRMNSSLPKNSPPGCLRLRSS